MQAFTILMFFLTAVSAAGSGRGEGVMCIIDVGTRHQTIANFGASDCWSIQYVGRWPEEKRNAIADLLFSTAVDTNGKPVGIGLSQWRFNIGAGSAPPPASPTQPAPDVIPDPFRRTECLQLPDGSWDWSRQAGQQWFLKAAWERGVRQFLGFSNSPPAHMTQNGLTFNKGRGDSLNLRPDMYDAYADFLARVVIGLEKSTGVRLSHLSPFNEPEWDWQKNSQEGTPALNAEIAREVRALDRKLSLYGLDTRIIMPESGKLDYLYKEHTDKPGRDNKILDFFSPSSADFIGGLAHVPPIVAGHAYWTVNPVGIMRGRREELRGALGRSGLSYWQTEACLLEQVPGVGGGDGRDLGMRTALFFARLIHTDMVAADAAAWQWWLAVSPYDYKDGLVYIFPNADMMDGSFKDSKLLWVLGNYSRFVRPGAVRVDARSAGGADARGADAGGAGVDGAEAGGTGVDGAEAGGAGVDDPAGLMISAYIGPQPGVVTAVAVNYGDDPKSVTFSLPGLKVRKAVPYVTSDDPADSLAPGRVLPESLQLRVKGRSVTTIVFECE